MTNISTVDELMQALWDAQDATEPVNLVLTSVSYDLSSSLFERDERFGSGVTESCLPHITTEVTIDVDTPFDFAVLYQDNPNYRLFYVTQTGHLELSHIKLRSGTVGAMDTGGGAIFNEGELLVSHCEFSENYSNYGGAILNMKGQTDILNCYFHENEADWGGALYNGPVANGCVMNVTNSRIHQNLSTVSWGVGGGVTNFGTLNLEHCMITYNVANLGGGVANWAANAVTTVKHTHILNNDASTNGGGVMNEFGTTHVEASTLVDNTALSGRQAYKSNGTLTLLKVSLPDVEDPPIDDVSTGINVTTPLPVWYPNFTLIRDTTTRELVPTYHYNRLKAAQRAIELSQDNFLNFPEDSVGAVVGYIDFPDSPRRKRDYSAVLQHNVTIAGEPPNEYEVQHTGSAIFISEMIHYGGLPMTIDNGDNPASPDCTGTDQITTGAYTDRGWRYCPTQESATQNWKFHPGIIAYFNSLPGGGLIGTVTKDEIGDIIWVDPENGFPNSGTLIGNTGAENTMINRFNPDLSGDLASVAIGDYLYIGSHGFIVVGWGPLNGTLDGIDHALTIGVSPTRSYPNLIPYIADFCYGTGVVSSPEATGWLQDPRPRPFYTAATRVFQEKLTSDQLAYLKQREVIRPPVTPSDIEPVYDNFIASDWHFYKIPSTIATSVVINDRLYFMG